MSREIEADGYITREEDLTPIKSTCLNCKRYRYDENIRMFYCTNGHRLHGIDWRLKYSVCPDWEKKE